MEKITQEQHYHGLSQWVHDYKMMRRNGNVKNAIALRDRIKEIIAKENLDADRVWGNDPDAPRRKP